MIEEARRPVWLELRQLEGRGIGNVGEVREVMVRNGEPDCMCLAILTRTLSSSE